MLPVFNLRGTFELFKDGVSVAVAGPVNAALASAASSTATFTLNPSVTIPANATVTFTVKADVASFTSGAISNSTHAFKINANGNLTSLSGGSSTASVTVTGAPIVGNTQSVFRTKFVVAGSNTIEAHSRTASDDIGTITFTADGATEGIPQLQSVVIYFSGQAVSTGTLLSVQLIDAETGTNLAGDLGDATADTGTSTCTTVTNSCSVIFNVNKTFTAGQAKTVTVRLNSSSFYQSGNGDSMSAEITSASGVTFGDGTTNTISLPATMVPVRIGTASYN